MSDLTSTTGTQDEHGPADLDAYSLDDPVPRPVPRPSPVGRFGTWFRRGQLRVAAVLPLTMLTAVAAGLGTHAWDEHQQARRQQSVVALLASVGPIEQASGRSGDRFTLDGAVRLVNTGPAPLRVEDLRASTSTVTVTLRGRARNVPAGGIADMDISAVVRCYASALGEPIPLTLSVRTAAGERRQVTVLLEARIGSWPDQAFAMCATS